MNLGDDANRLAAEARARVLIDRHLTEAGWSVQDSRALNLFAAQGVARRARRNTSPPTAPPAPPHQNTVGYWWRKTLRDAGLSGIKLHDLRHFYTSGLIAAGATW